MKKMFISIFIISLIIMIDVIKCLDDTLTINDGYIIILDKISIYDSNDNIIGYIDKNTTINIEVIDYDTYKIVDTSYYLKTTNIKNIDFSYEDEAKYIEILGTIDAGYIKLYQNNELVVEIDNNTSFEVKRQDDNYYYISYLGNTFTLKKEDYTLKENTNNTIVKSIYLPTIKDTCSDDNCIRTNVYEEIMNYLEKNNYYFITTDEYSDYLNHYINLNNRAIFITSTNDNKDLLKEYVNIDYEENTYDYTVNRYTTLDDIKFLLDNQEVNSYNGDMATEISVLNYHFFYDKETEECSESICLDINNFEEQLNYLKENNYKTLTIDEFISWMNKEIDIPEKSVLITIDDGAMGTSTTNGNKLIPILEKYQMHATLFLITGWWNKDNYKSDYLNIESHTNLMHEESVCSNKTRGAKLLCSSYDEIIADLKTSIKKLESNKAFCFPFYLYSDDSIKALKELGFSVAFIGNNEKVNQDTNKYKIPRYIIYKNTSLDSFKMVVS